MSKEATYVRLSSLQTAKADLRVTQVTGGEHVAISQAMALDAINTFCDRSGDGQQYTLDPAVTPDVGFTGDSCTTKGMASCGYYYRNDGTKTTKDGDLGDISIRIKAAHFNPNDALECNAAKVYEVHGDR